MIRSARQVSAAEVETAQAVRRRVAKVEAIRNFMRRKSGGTIKDRPASQLVQGLVLVDYVKEEGLTEPHGLVQAWPGPSP